VGETVVLSERVASSLSSAQFTVSPTGVLAYRAGDRAAGRKLVWYERAGGPPADLGIPGEYTSIALSPDGARVAFSQVDPRGFNPDIWIFDLARKVPTRFTFPLAEDAYPVWSPDGSKVAFTSRRNGPYELYVKNSNGAGEEERLQKAGDYERPTAWSSDGRFLMYMRNSGDVTNLWTLEHPLDPAKRKASPYFETPYNVTQGQFSPDLAGSPRWVAYTSDESKQGYEVYVQSFPTGVGKFQISNGGGAQPRWRRDGRELFYMARDGRIMAVDVKISPGFQAGIPHPLFDSRMSNPMAPNLFRYDVTADGRRFLVNLQAQKETAVPDPITVVTNWQSGMKR
jgi:dipeptidyl aminopeptidase/acylaminoacyl peptidase